MSKTSTVCACEHCSGPGCTCGCQAVKTPPPPTCKCGADCKCGSVCGYK